MYSIQATRYGYGYSLGIGIWICLRIRYRVRECGTKQKAEIEAIQGLDKGARYKDRYKDRYKHQDRDKHRKGGTTARTAPCYDITALSSR